MALHEIHYKDGRVGILDSAIVAAGGGQILADFATIGLDPSPEQVDDVVIKAIRAHGNDDMYFMSLFALKLLGRKLLPELLAAAEAKGVDLAADLYRITAELRQTGERDYW